MKRLFVVMTILLATLLFTYAQNRQIPFSPQTDTITATNVNNLEAIFTFDEHTRHVSVSPNGKLLAVASQVVDADYNILIFDIETREEITHIQGRMDGFRDLIWSPDSNWVATISGRLTGGGVEERSVKTYFIPTDGTDYTMGFSDLWFVDYVYPSSRTEYPSIPVSVAWSSASDMIAVAFYNKLSVYDVTVEEEIELFTATIEGLTNVDWSANGALIITEDSNHRIQVWGVPDRDD
jgi:WD40 repeat protein